MLGGAQVRNIIELHAAGLSIRQIAKKTGLSRNSVRKYLRAPGLPIPKPRPKRGSRLDAHTTYLQARFHDGVYNAVVLLRELKTRGYTGSYTIVKDFVRDHRPKAETTTRPTMRFETDMGEQAQVDFGQYTYLTPEGTKKRVWAFVMVLGWSRAIYVEFIPKADTAAFIRCHLHAFEHFGGTPRSCLYDNTKLVVIDRDDTGEPVWNEKFLDFSLRVGFAVKLCRPYRARTKGKVESGVKYVEGNFWPTARFTDLDDLNTQVKRWVIEVADARVHGTTREVPAERLAHERRTLRALPAQPTLRAFLTERRKVGWDGYVTVHGSHYGVPWKFMGQVVDVLQTPGEVQVYAHDELVARHPKAPPGARVTWPHQYQGLAEHQGQPREKAVVARQIEVPDVDVQHRPLSDYAALVDVAGASL